MNYGSTLASYSLDNIASHELKLQKFEYKGTNKNLDDFYINDPSNYALYNIIDVALLVRLNEKLKHIELHNLLRRMQKAPYTRSLVGNSALFDAYILNQLTAEENKVRHGMNTENSIIYKVSDFDGIPQPKEKKGLVKPIDISAQEYREITMKFDGAYVKASKSKIIVNGLLMDLDASLPPWEKIFIRRNNKVYWNKIGNYNFIEGDETLTWDKNNNSCWKKVLGKIEKQWNRNLTTVITETGKKTTVTDNHSIYGLKKGIKCSNPHKIEAGELQKGDYVVSLAKFEPGCNKQSNNPELIGFWLSDGWGTISPYTASFYIAKQDKTKLEIFSPDINNIRIKKKACEQYKEEWVGTIQEPIKSELHNIFYYSTKLKNFQEILNYTPEQRKLIWKGMMDADGTIHSNGQSALCKYRQTELEECHIVSYTIDWKPSLQSNRIYNNTDRKFATTLVPWEVFRDKKGYGSILCKNNLASNCRHPLYKLEKILPHVKNAVTNSIGLERIKKIETRQYTGSVYDISVEGTERFMSGTGIGVCNTALYPSMINQSNIGFDSFRGRLISPLTYKILGHLERTLGKDGQADNKVYNALWDMTKEFIENSTMGTKAKSKVQWYYLAAKKLKTLYDSGISLDRILNPTCDRESILLIKYLIPFLDIWNNIHPKRKEFNHFVYDYIFDNNPENVKKDYPFLYIIKDIHTPNQRLEKVLFDDAIKYLGDYSLTITGCVFTKHEDYTGLFTETLINLKQMRKDYKGKMFKYPKGSPEFNFWNNRQLSVKIVMNSIYGVSGLKTFRYSNHWLAQSITTSGRLAIKLAQHLAEEHLKEKFNESNSN